MAETNESEELSTLNSQAAVLVPSEGTTTPSLPTGTEETNPIFSPSRAEIQEIHVGLPQRSDTQLSRFSVIPPISTPGSPETGSPSMRMSRERSALASVDLQSSSDHDLHLTFDLERENSCVSVTERPVSVLQGPLAAIPRKKGKIRREVREKKKKEKPLPTTPYAYGGGASHESKESALKFARFLKRQTGVFESSEWLFMKQENANPSLGTGDVAAAEVKVTFTDINFHVKEFLISSLETREKIERDLHKSNCEVHWPNNEAEQIELVNKSMDELEIDEYFWVDNISRIFAGTLQNYVLFTNVLINEGFFEKIKDMLVDSGVNSNRQVGMVNFAPGNELCIVGSKDYVTETNVKALRLQAELDHNAKTLATIVPTSSPSVITLLEINKVTESIENEFPGVHVLLSQAGVQLTGSRDVVERAEVKTKVIVSGAVVTEITDVSTEFASMLCNPKIITYINQCLTTAQSPSMIHYSEDRCFVTSLSKSENKRAVEEVVTKLVREIIINIDPQVAMLRQWIECLNQLNSNCPPTAKIKFDHETNAFLLCGAAEVVESIEKKLKDILRGLEIKDHICVLSVPLGKVLELDPSWKEEIKCYGDNLLEMTLITDRELPCMFIQSTCDFLPDIIQYVAHWEKKLIEKEVLVKKLGIHKYFAKAESRQKLADISGLTKTYITVGEAETESQRDNDDFTHVIEGNVTVRIVQGLVEQQQSDVLVNVLMEVGEIAQIYGPDIAQEYKRNLPMAMSGIVSTNGHGLPFKKIFHVLLQTWDGTDEGKAAIDNVIDSSLRLATFTSSASVTYPVGSFLKLGFSSELTSRRIIRGLHKFAQQATVVQSVTLAAHGNEALILQLCSEISNPTVSRGPTPELTVPLGEGQETCHIKFKNGTVLSLVDGSITCQKVDAIVNSVGGLTLGQGDISQTILKEAGPELQQEMNQTGNSLNPGEMVVTSGKKLPVKSIFHVNPGTTHSPELMRSLVEKCLQKATELGYQSIAFPSIGTGGFGWCPDAVATLTVLAIKVFDEKGTSPLQTSVVFPDFGSEKFQSYTTAMAACDGFVDTKHKTNHIKVQKDNSTDEDHETELIENGTSLFRPTPQAPEIIPLIFHVYGLQKGAVDDSAARLQTECVDDQHKTSYMEDYAIDLMEESDITNAKMFAYAKGVNLQIEKTNRRMITLQGYKEDVDSVATEIQNVYREVNKRQAAKLADLIQVQWELEIHGELVPFSAANSATIERQFQNKGRDETTGIALTVDDGDLKYAISFTDMTAKISDSQAESESISCIYRRSLDLPKHWFPADDKEVEFYDLEPRSDEYKAIISEFDRGLGRTQATIQKIQRIQNSGLFRMYSALKNKMEKALPDVAVERQLWHGTSIETISSISRNCFDRSYSGKNATVYGQGVYFAVNSGYSAGNTYSKPDSQGNKYMYLVRVLVGRYTVGDHSMKYTPAIDPQNPSVKYDSLVDDQNTPNMFVVFNDSQAYPEYLITFRT